MKKDELISFVRNLVLKAEPVSDNIKPVHYKRVEQAVAYAFDGMLGTLYKEGEEGRWEIESYFVKHYRNQQVLESNGYRYIGLTDVMANLPNGKAVWYVQPRGDGKPFLQMGRPQISLLRSTVMGNVMNEVVWYIGNVTSTSPRQVVFEVIGNPAFSDIRRVDYGIVRGFESYGETEDIHIPDGRFDVLIATAVNWFGQRYNDIVNNNQ